MAYLETDSPISLGSDGNSRGFNDSWIWIILIFALLGFGSRGFGTSGQSGGVMDSYVLASDFANIERKIDGVNNGLCDGFYAMNTGMLNGFSALGQSVMQSGYETRNGIKDTQYAIATQTSALQQSLCAGFRDIIDSQNATYRALHDEIVANRIEDKNAQITAQQNEINALRLKASQEAQNAYLISELKPCPRPAYITCNPYQSYPSYTTYGSTCGGSVL